MTSAESLGSVSCSLRGRVVAGSYRTCRLTYTAGFYGIDDTGSIKVAMRYATDCGVPQFDRPDSPNYTTARASNGARLQLRYDPKDNLRPWGRTLHLKIVQGFLRQGDRIDLTLGDRSNGSPGWRIQTFVERTFELRVLVDRFRHLFLRPLAGFSQVPGGSGQAGAPGGGGSHPGRCWRADSGPEQAGGSLGQSGGAPAEKDLPRL